MKTLTFLLTLCSITTYAQWSTHNMPAEVYLPYKPAVVNNKLVIVPTYPATEAQVYDYNSDSWTSYEMPLLFNSNDAQWGPFVVGNDLLYFKSSKNKIMIYDSETNLWTTDSLSDYSESATFQVAGTKLFVAGGRFFNDPNNNYYASSRKVDIYDSETNQWTRDTLSERKHDAKSFVFGNKVMIAGGRKPQPPHASNSVGIYDMDTNSWEWDTISNYFSFEINKINNKILICGGLTKDIHPSNTLDIYDIDNHTWTYQTLSRPVASYNDDQVVAINNKLVIFNGSSALIYDGNSETWDSVTVSSNDTCLVTYTSPPFILGDSIFFSFSNCKGMVQIYDSENNIWTTHQISRKRSRMTIKQAGNKILFISGGTSNAPADDNIDIYDLQTGNWSLRHLSSGRYNFSVLTHGEQAIIAGGYVDPPIIPDFYCYSDYDVYNAATNQITSSPIYQAGGCYMESNIIGSKAMLAGGFDFQTTNNIIDIYDFSTSTWDFATLSDEYCCSEITRMGNKLFFAGKNYVDIYTDPNIPASAGEAEKGLSVNIFPNPATDHLSLLIPESVTLPAQIELCDASGKNLLRMQATEAQSQIPIQQLPAGLYVLKITAKEGTTTRKVVRRAE